MKIFVFYKIESEKEYIKRLVFSQSLPIFYVQVILCRKLWFMPLTTVSFLAGVIYCFSRKDTEQVAFELVKRGINACSYHASMGGEEKALNHRNWIENKIQV